MHYCKLIKLKLMVRLNSSESTSEQILAEFFGCKNFHFFPHQWKKKVFFLANKKKISFRSKNSRTTVTEVKPKMSTFKRSKNNMSNEGQRLKHRVELVPCNREVVGSIPAGCWAFFFFYPHFGQLKTMSNVWNRCSWEICPVGTRQVR